jgi:hypothetical protein
MWNRVILLCAGVAFGWNLVNYWSVSMEEKQRQAARLAIGLCTGMFIIVLLVRNSYQAGLIGAFVFLLSALVSYASNAKQVNKSVFHYPLELPPRPNLKDDRCAVLLLSEGEPRHYTGPKPWAAHFRAREGKDKAVPHWFTRPLTYARIRAAYQAMGEENPFNDAISHLAQLLAASLGAGYVVEDAYLRASPSLAPALLDLAKRGFTKIVLFPIELDSTWLTFAGTEITRSRVRELGVEVKLAPPPNTVCGLPKPYGDRLQQFLKGEAPTAPLEPSERTLEILQKQVGDAAT